MKSNPLRQLDTIGLGIWLDCIQRKLIAGGELRGLIEEGGLGGMASSPSIFEKAIVESHDYGENIRDIAIEGKDVNSVAGFFVSRIDALVDPLLDKLIAQGGRDASLAKKARG